MRLHKYANLFLIYSSLEELSELRKDLRSKELQKAEEINSGVVETDSNISNKVRQIYSDAVLLFDKIAFYVKIESLTAEHPSSCEQRWLCDRHILTSAFCSGVCH